MMQSLPLAMTGVDCPGKSATQRASLTAMESGKSFSREKPFCWGPRQLSQPRTGAAEAGEARIIPQATRTKNICLTERRLALTPAFSPRFIITHISGEELQKSRRDSAIKPRVARNELPCVHRAGTSQPQPR